MKDKLSIVIACRREVYLERTVNRIKATCRGELPELVVVFDNEPARKYAVDYPEDRLVVVERKGPRGSGLSKHAGIAAASGENIMLLDAHMDFVPGWAPEILQALEAYPSDILCGKMLAMDHNEMEFNLKAKAYTGAAVVPFRQLDDGKRSVLSAKWAEQQDGAVPCVMGACYAFDRKRYMDVLGGPLQYLRTWGCEEELLSLSNWCKGGESRLVPVEFGHVMGGSRPKAKDVQTTEEWTAMEANKAVVASVLPMSSALRSRMLEWLEGGYHQAVAEAVKASLASRGLDRLEKVLADSPRNVDQFISEWGCQDDIKNAVQASALPSKEEKRNRRPLPSEFRLPRQESVGKVICVMALHRNGSHPLHNWLASQMKGIRYRNSVRPDEIQKESLFDRSDTGLLPDAPRVAAGASTYMYAVENAKKPEEMERFLVGWQKADRKIIALTLRDPFNWFASVIKYNDNRPGAPLLHPAIATINPLANRDGAQAALELWMRYANQILLMQAMKNPDRIPVIYNKWVRSPEYRDELFDAFGLEIRSDHALGSTTKVGGGSSFDGAGTMADCAAVEGRWRNYATLGWYKDLFLANPQAVAASHKLFGYIAGVDDWLQEGPIHA